MARVIGTLVSTVKHPCHKNFKLLWVQPVNARGHSTEPAFIAIDNAQAGQGDYVLVVEEGKGVRQVLEDASVACEAVIIGVIDHLTIRGRTQKLAPPA